MKMKASLVILTVCLLNCLQVNSQNLSKYYFAKNQVNNTLYFINPTDGFNSGSGNDLIYDVTYLTSNDSVALNFSYFDKNTYKFSSISFEGNSVSYELKRLFIETKRSKWHYRYTIKLPLNEFKNFYEQANAPAITLHYTGGEKKLHIKQRTWDKLRVRMLRIIEITQLNK